MTQNQQQQIPGIYYDFFNKEYLSDCLIASSISPENFIYAHRIILAASSNYFNEQFKNSNANQSKIIIPKPIASINNEKVDQFQAVISFLYSDQSENALYKLNLNEYTAYGFLGYMKLLEIPKGLEIVTNYICNELLTEESCADVLLNAIKFDNKRLQAYAMETISKFFSKIWKNVRGIESLIMLPYHVIIELLSFEDLEVEDESIVANFIEKYIEFREKLEINPENQIKDQLVLDGKTRIATGEIKPEKLLEEKKAKNDEITPKNISTNQLSDGSANQDDIIKNPLENPSSNPDNNQNQVSGENLSNQNSNQSKSNPNEVLDLEAEAQKKLKNYHLNDDQIIQLIKLIRLPFLSHDMLIKTAQKKVFLPFRDIFMESLSAKLHSHEPTNQSNFSINMQPRETYRPGTNSYFIYQKICQSSTMQTRYNGYGEPLRLTPPKSNANIRGKFDLQNQLSPQSHFPSKGIAEFNNTYSSNRRIATDRDYFSPLGSNTYQSNELNSPILIVSHSTNRTANLNTLESNNSISLQQNQYKQSKMIGKVDSAGNPKYKHKVIEFVYKFDFDENGALYYLGSLGKQTYWQNPHRIGQVKVFFSSLGRGNIEDFVGRSIVNCRTLNEPNSFMGVDIGKYRFLIPSCYTIRNRSSSTHVLMNWVLEASINGNEWYWLDKRIFLSNNQQINQALAKDREELKIKGFTSTWSIHPNQIQKIQNNMKNSQQGEFHGFRYFKITQIGQNSDGSYNFGLSGFEIYGNGIGPGWFLAFR